MNQHAAAAAFRALADPTRRKLFERLAREGEMTVSDLTRTAAISQPAVSQHLAALKVANLVRERREGRLAHYRAESNGLKPLANWLELYSKFWRERFDKLEEVLAEMKE